MTEEMSDDTLVRYYEDLLRIDKYRLKITEAGEAYPDQRSIHVEFDDIDNFNRDLADYLLHHPIKSLGIAEEAVRKILPPDIQFPIHVRIEGLPETSNILIRELRGEHLGKFLAIDGLVRKVTEVRPKLIEAHFLCVRCGFDNIIPQNDIYVKEPFECEGCQKSANQTSFQFLQDFSKYIDTQKIEVQENPEGLRGGEQPQRLTAYLEDDIAGHISPGDRVTINGILMSRQKHSGKLKSTVFDIFLDVNSAETKQSEYDALEISEDDIVEIEKLAKQDGIYDKLTKSIAPSIFGMDMEKQALTLQIFGGVRKFMPDGTKIRGDVHVLFVGDPGTAKSQLLRYTSQISPRGIYTSGQATTKAGLTATAVKEEFGDGRWTLEAGALVLADMGIACLHPDTEVLIDGVWQTIESQFNADIAEEAKSNGDTVFISMLNKETLSLTDDGSFTVLPSQATVVRKKEYSGDFIQLEFESGFQISLTPDHKLIDGTSLQWKQAGEFRRRELIVAPFKYDIPSPDNDTIVLLAILHDMYKFRNEEILVQIDGNDRKYLIEAILRRRRGLKAKEKKHFLSFLLPADILNYKQRELVSYLQSSVMDPTNVPAHILFSIIDGIRIWRRYKNRSLTIINPTIKEQFEISELPPMIFYLFGRVYTDDKRMIRETRPIRLLFQKFHRTFKDEFHQVCMDSFGKTISPTSRFLEELYHFITRDYLAHISDLPDPCIRSFLAGLIDTNVNVSIDTRERKQVEFHTVILRIILPTLEKEAFHLLCLLRRYNIYGRLIRRKHMFTIHISNDSDVNNLREILKDYSINMKSLPESRPHFYDIATTFTTSNQLPEDHISSIAQQLLDTKKFNRTVQTLLEEFAQGRKTPVREHFNIVMPHIQDENLGHIRQKLENLLSRGYMLDRIVNITRSEYHGPVYDLHVPEYHNFIANGIIVHNCIDELDKMSKEDSSGMHEALEQQQISIAKAGITATLQSRCSLLAAANPKFGRFDDNENIIAQINMLPSLISRFDLIFPIFDKPEPGHDGAIADHIMKVQTEGERIEHNKAMELDAESTSDMDEAIIPEIPVEFIRKYIAHAKRISYPILTEEAATYLRDNYVQFRQGNKNPNMVAITARQLEAMVRLAEASARIRLSSSVTRDDAVRAVKVVEYSLMRVASDKDGNVDIDKLGGVPQKKRSRLITLRKLIEEICKESDDNTFTEEQLIDRAKPHHLGSDQVKSYLKKTMEGGELYEPTAGKYRFL